MSERSAALVYLVLRSLDDGREAAKLVVFVSSTTVATQIADALPGVIGFNASFLLTSRLSPEQTHAMLWDFERLNRPGVLITDRTGEDGLNLQFADGVLHLDLPTSLMRMEQRMGRLDRIGRGERRSDSGSLSRPMTTQAHGLPGIGRYVTGSRCSRRAWRTCSWWLLNSSARS